jgi:hypothetical protein
MMRTLLGIGLVIVAFTSILCAEEKTETTRFNITEMKILPIEVLEDKWGTEPGEFGIIIEGEEKPDMPFGPTHFAVDSSGKIYVADKYNSRVQVFDGEGKLIQIVSVEDKQLLNRISIDMLGNMYLVNYLDGRIAVFDRKLKLLETGSMNVMVADTVLGVGGYEFTVDANGNPVIIGKNKIGEEKRISIIKQDTEDIKYESLNYFKISRLLYEYPQIRRKATNIIEIIVEQTREPSKSVVIKENQRIWSYWRVGIDRKGKFYYAVETSNSLFVYVVDFETNDARKISIITNIWHGAYRSPVLGLDGNLYYMGSSKEKFWIDKYPLNQ